MKNFLTYFVGTTISAVVGVFVILPYFGDRTSLDVFLGLGLWFIFGSLCYKVCRAINGLRELDKEIDEIRQRRE